MFACLILSVLSLVINHLLRCKMTGIKITRYSFVASGLTIKNWLPIKMSNSNNKRHAWQIKMINFNIWLFYFTALVIPLVLYLVTSLM